MDLITRKVALYYRIVFHELRDPRSKDFSLAEGPGAPFVILICYLVFCTKLGPWIMRNRKPLNLKKFIFLYNVFQVAMSLFLFQMGLSYMMSASYSLKCETLDYSNNPRALFILSATWWCYFSKVTELTETVIFALRKKNKQISVLHLYHHSLMLVTMWMALTYFPGGQPVLGATINAFVHIHMYIYYLASGVVSDYQRRFQLWKKLITALQIVQFIINLVHTTYGIITGCDYPVVFACKVIVDNAVFIYLFGRFYYKTYVRDNKNSAVNYESKVDTKIKCQ